MISLLRSVGRKSLALLAVLIVGLLPAAVQAENIIIKNTTSAQVSVQVAVIVRGRAGITIVPIWNKPLAAGQSTPAVAAAGNKLITIVDPAAKPLLQQGVPGAAQDQYWDIVAGPNGRMGLSPGTPPKSP
jgi:hypothetical protein